MLTVIIVILENRSSSLGAVALKSSMLSDTKPFGQNKTAPTSPTDSHVSPPTKRNVFLNEVMTYQTSPEKEIVPKRPEENNKPTEKKEVVVETVHNSLPTPQKLRQQKEVTVSDSSLYQVQCCTKRGAFKNKSRKSSCCIC